MPPSRDPDRGTTRPDDDPLLSEVDRSLWFGVSSRVALLVGLPISILLTAVSLTVWLLWHDVETGPRFGLLALTNVDREAGVPAWFSSALLLACAASLWTVGAAVRRRGERRHWPWVFLALVFTYMSLDEAAGLHEEVMEPVQEALDLGGVFFYGWIVVAIPVLVVVALVLLPFLRSLEPWTRRAFLLSGAVYVGGALGLEMVESSIADAGGRGSTALHLTATTQELLEMVGLTLFLAAINEHRRRYVERLRPVPPRSTV